MKATCEICFHHCSLAEGQIGFCGARKNVDGKVICDNYGKITAIALDPIEKKPLKHFFPGSYILSIGSYGCNLHCPFCQNSDISMQYAGIRTHFISPQELVNKALELKSDGNIGVAYTYNEPFISYEYVTDCAGLVHQNEMKNVMVTNGTVEEAPLRKILPLIDAMNIDLKGFTGEYYRKLSGNLEVVKRTIEIAAKECHIEVTTLIVPGENDSDEEMEALAGWLASVDPEIPYHVSRFFPHYHMPDKPPTPVKTVYHLAEIARKHLKYVYTGNC
ncbi:MAG TPA: AmmeMemoRadiSam system radical SAM enzyme [Flexilinea sp.]|nr:AmmeMemoRadiSam system radical SAM enzyme [Flexilinea sp.]